MRRLLWDTAKNEKLKKERGVSFEEIVRCKLVGVMQHSKRSNQRVMLFERNDYIWVVPYVTRGQEIFLKTMFPSRKYTKVWRGGCHIL